MDKNQTTALKSGTPPSLLFRDGHRFFLILRGCVNFEYEFISEDLGVTSVRDDKFIADFWNSPGEVGSFKFF
jgi:hypothetical protein